MGASVSCLVLRVPKTKRPYLVETYIVSTMTNRSFGRVGELDRSRTPGSDQCLSAFVSGLAWRTPSSEPNRSIPAELSMLRGLLAWGRAHLTIRCPP